TERQYHPGGIICQCVNNTTFAVQGFDRAGNLLTGYGPVKYFYIECRDGSIVPQKLGDVPLPKKDNQLPAKVIVYTD
ncbi:hypothetical protein ABTD78_25795, partial [Acinetobacter baumannii]